MPNQTSMTNHTLDERTKNIKENLINQADKLFKSTNQGSIKTKYRYLAAEERFAGFLADKYRLQKLANVKAKHIESYVKFMVENGKSSSTIKTDLAGIRLFHMLSGSKNRLPDNGKLNLEKRQVGKVDRGWSEEEYENARKIAFEMGRTDVGYGMIMGYHFGMRLEEVCRCQVTHLKDALINGELYVKGKNGQERYVRIDNDEKEKIIKTLCEFAKSQNRKGTDRILFDNIKGATQKTKKSIQNWIANNRKKFQLNDRESYGAEVVPVLTFHGLRHTYAQRQYKIYLNKGDKDGVAKSKLSEELGHHRTEITKIYLNEKRSLK